ncbi:MAG: DNA adenine methylase [Candidatus Moranbacteria bacterium]|nr:DNA adenine methylase [Candidatus Moranbacteria bacterium]
MTPRNKDIQARPFLKWVGGKAQLLSQLEQYYPKNFNNYFEPFIGGGALFFNLSPTKAHINDINITLISAYNNIKNKPEELMRILKKLEIEYKKGDEENKKELFYKIREEFNNMSDTELKKSAYMIFLNKTCFNGMYRENSKGGFNTPFGKAKNPTILDRENILLVSKVLQHTKLTSVSFDKAIAGAKKGDFVYFDPPYHPLTETAKFTSYHKDSFTKDDQLKLRDVFIELDKRGCYVMLSNSHSPFINDIYKKYRRETVMANRAINCKASGRGKIKELLILNY